MDAAIFLLISAVEKLLHQLLAHRCHGSLVEVSMGVCLQGWAVALSEGAKNRDDTCTEFDRIFCPKTQVAQLLRDDLPLVRDMGGT